MNYLNSKLDLAKASLVSVERPANVILKYKELLKNTYNLEMILSSLENEKLFVTLENAKENERWELISKPNVLDEKIEPSGLISLFFTLIIMMTISPAVIYIKDKNFNKVSSNKELN